MEVNDLSGVQYSTNKNVRFKNPMLRLDLCDYSDANIVVKGKIAIEGMNENNQADKNNAPFRSYIQKISNFFKNNANDLLLS